MNKLLRLRARLVHIEARSKYLDAPGVRKKVIRQIKRLEKELGEC